MAGKPIDPLKRLASQIIAAGDRVKASNRQAIKEGRKVGELFLEVKASKEREGTLDAWCEMNAVPFDRSWRAKLMKLARHWPDIEPMLAENPKTWTIDGALKAWRKTRPPKSKAAIDSPLAIEKKIDRTRELLARLEAELAQVKCGVTPQMGEDEPERVDEEPDQNIVVAFEPKLNRHERRRREKIQRGQRKCVPVEAVA